MQQVRSSFGPVVVDARSRWSILLLSKLVRLGDDAKILALIELGLI